MKLVSPGLRTVDVEGNSRSLHLENQLCQNLALTHSEEQTHSSLKPRWGGTPAPHYCD